ncbi:MAG: ABC transporter ATP-binding protein [Acidobacteriota bacterium]
MSKVYEAGETPVQALREVDLTIERGEFVAIVGPSGCGKTTLLQICGGMEHPTAGSVLVGGTELQRLDDRSLTRWRRRQVGFVFQFFNLLPTLVAWENVALPLLLDGVGSASARRVADEMLNQVGLSHRANHLPQQMSGGEMQRVAIARALVHQPALIIADEPTGNLDSANGARILELLSTLQKDLQVTLMLATHAEEIASAAESVIHLRDGKVERRDRHQDTFQSRH